MKLSLIFCCYNVSKYLDGIYKWLCEQPYQNIEVIFVEDCATDDTKERLFSLVHDPRMKIIENPRNLGLSESRNIGLRHATGDYVGFPDPDDQFDTNWLLEIADISKNNSINVIITGMREDYETNDKLEFSKDIISKFSGGITRNNIFDALVDLEQSFLLGYMNNKFYNREFLIENKFSCKSLALKEDFEFNINVFSKVDSLYILNKPYYFYKKRTNGNTLTSKFVPEYFDIHMDTLLQFKSLLEVYQSNLSKQSEILLVNRFVRYFLSSIERNTSKSACLTFNDQKEWIESIFSNSKYNYFLERLDLITGKIKIIECIFSARFSWLLVILGNIIKYLKANLPILFAKLK